MALRVPVNCSSITFTTSGVKAPVARLITGLTAAEETALAQWSRYQRTQLINANLSTGAIDIQFPAGIMTSITINGNVKAINGAGVCSAVVAADATAFLGATQNEPFQTGAG